MGVSQQQIYAWKAQYGTVLKKKLEDRDVYYRPLTVQEMRFLEGKEDLAVKIVPDVVILNDVNLTLPGSRVSLTQDVMQYSRITDEDDLKKRAIENRLKVEENFYLSLITKICSVFISYTPDDLEKKTLRQLLEITAMAETACGKHIILTGDEKKGPPTRMPRLHSGEKWTPPEEKTGELMEESVDALSKEMKKHGKTVPTLAEKKKTGTVQSQMAELSKFLH